MKIIKIDYIQSTIFNPQNIREIAQLLYDENTHDLDKKEKISYIRLRFILRGDDGTQYEDDTMAIFGESGIFYTRKIVSVDLSYSFGWGDKDISVGLHHSVYKDYANNIQVSGTDESWVEGKYARLQEIIKNCERQKALFTKYSTPIALFIWACIVFSSVILAGLVATLEKSILHISNPETLRTIIVATYSVILGSFFYLGMDWSSSLSNKIDALYPNVELLIGPGYLQREVTRRRKLRNSLLTIIIPTIIAIAIAILF